MSGGNRAKDEGIGKTGVLLTNNRPANGVTVVHAQQSHGLQFRPGDGQEGTCLRRS